MASADVVLKQDQGNRLFFAYSPMRALAFAVVSLGLTWVCWNFIEDEPIVRYGATAFTLLFVLAGVGGFFWRMELDIDLGRRRVRTRRGMWPSPKTRERGLDEADGIWLDMEYRSQGSKRNRRKVPWWFVSLKFPDEKKGTRLFATRGEVEGYRKWEYYAERLKLDAVDATAEQPQRQSWQELDDKLTAQSRESTETPVSTSTPPADSKVEVFYDGGRKEIRLPPPGFNVGLVFLSLFGGAFAALGGGGLFASLGLIDVPVQGSPWAVRIVPPVFLLIGLGIVWLGIKGSYSALVIGVERGALFVEQLAFGRRSARRSVPLAEIESVSVAGDVRSRRRTGGYVKIGGVALGGRRFRERDSEVVVRSDRRILRFGSALSDPEKAWLADACRYATVRGQLP